MSIPATSVLIVDDDTVMREQLSDEIAQTEGFAVAGVAGGFADALTLIDGAGPSILLLDLGLPGGSGLGLISPARARGHQCLVISVHEDDRSVFSAIERGAVGYVLKTGARVTIAEALRATREGESFVSPRIARRLIGALGPPASTALTEREFEVIELFSRGLTYAEVGRVCGISVNTVRAHVRQSYEKLHVSSKAEAVTTLFAGRSQSRSSR